MSFESRFQFLNKRVPIAEDNVAIVHDLSKCKNCTLCRKACADNMSVLDYYDLESTGDNPICVQCGQCVVICPFGSLKERTELDKVQEAISDPDKIVVIQTAPAVRVGIGEEFGYAPGEFLEGKMVGALRALGADYVVDTNFGADLTIMEEANELLERVVHGKGALPQFTSCCPAWVRFCETFYPELIPNISSARSCIAMEAAAIKTYLAKTLNIDPKKIVSVSIAPCTAKKAEIRRPGESRASQYWGDEEYPDTDYCLTTREFADWIRQSEVDFTTVEEASFDRLIGTSSGAGIIFANTGGVMEAAMRAAKFFTTGEAPSSEPLVKLTEVRGMADIKEAEVNIGDRTLKIAVVHAGKNIRAFLDDLKASGKHYDFVEMMMCRGGCVGGGGQPRTKLPAADKTKEARIQGLYERDDTAECKISSQNPEIQQIYDNFLGAPLSELSEALLHTTYIDRSEDLGPRRDVVPTTCPTSPKFKPEE